MKRKTLLPARCKQVVSKMQPFAHVCFNREHLSNTQRLMRRCCYDLHRKMIGIAHRRLAPKEPIVDAARRLFRGRDFHQPPTLWNLKFESEALRYWRDRSWRGRVD